jgi:signal transduction histidine kinase
VVQVAQPMAARTRLAGRLALRAVAPMALMLPLAAVLVWFMVGRALSPVRRLALEVGSRDATALQPLALEDLPEEIRPLGAALNDLLAELAAAIAAQQAFVADAAHGLRMPLTALGLQGQAGRATRATTRNDVRRLPTCVQGSRARPPDPAAACAGPGRTRRGRMGPGEVDLASVARQAVTLFSPVAAREGVEVELELPAQPVPVHADADALQILIGNLLDNALRHGSRAGGSIGVAVTPGPPARRGRGAAGRTGGPVERGRGPLPCRAGLGSGDRSRGADRVFDRFYRPPGTQAGGSGLGLAIVQRIAARHDARLRLEPADPGLRVSIEFPVHQPCRLIRPAPGPYTALTPAARLRRRSDGDAR